MSYETKTFSVGDKVTTREGAWGVVEKTYVVKADVRITRGTEASLDGWLAKEYMDDLRPGHFGVSRYGDGSDNVTGKLNAIFADSFADVLGKAVREGVITPEQEAAVMVISLRGEGARGGGTKFSQYLEYLEGDIGRFGPSEHDEEQRARIARLREAHERLEVRS